MENQGTLANDNTYIEDKINKICRQTDYTYDIAATKLTQHNGDELSVIREFFGITEKKAPSGIVSVNQEIYKQIRAKLDSSMREYNIRIEKGEAKNIT